MEVGLDVLRRWDRAGDVASLTEVALDASSDYGSRFFAVRYLGHFVDAQTVDALAVLLSDDDERLRAQAARSLREVGPAAERAVEPLRRALFDGDGHVRVGAARALGEIGDRSAVADLVKVADTTAWDTLHSWTTASLVKLGAPEAVEHLVRRLNAEKAWQRRWAARELGAVGMVDAVEPLRAARRRDPLHRRVYTSSIQQIERRAVEQRDH